MKLKILFLAVGGMVLFLAGNPAWSASCKAGPGNRDQCMTNCYALSCSDEDQACMDCCADKCKDAPPAPEEESTQGWNNSGSDCPECAKIHKKDLVKEAPPTGSDDGAPGAGDAGQAR